MALSGGRVYVIWTNGDAVEYWAAGKVAVLSKQGAFPSSTALPDGEVLAAWEENGGVQVRRLR